MVVSFANGTARQRQLVNDAIAECTFQFDRLEATVTFTFEPRIDPALHGGKFGAVTFVDQLPTHAEIHVLADLANPRSSFYAGDDFFKESVIHELGHVVTLSLAPDQQAVIAGALGADYRTQWDLGAVKGWTLSAAEGAAETFKDLFFPGRKYNNRTRWRLRS